MRAFCTIITSNYLPYAATLYRSLIKFHKDEKFFVLVCDEGELPPGPIPLEGIIRLGDLMGYKETGRLYFQYAKQNMDAFRWAMKPVLLRYLLEKACEKVIYADSDLFFFEDYDFLFDELNTADVLLTPAWRTANPAKNEEEFIHLYTDGLYNAGFIAVNENAIPALEWWAHVCSYRMEIDYEHGLFVDQKYLDALPVLFDQVKIIKHKGCNVAIWNQIECQRVDRNGDVLINGKQPIVFIHFQTSYVREVLEGNDQLLLPYLKIYISTFAESGFELGDFIKNLPPLRQPGFVKTLKQKTLIRTRFKNFMHRLIDKI